MNRSIRFAATAAALLATAGAAQAATTNFIDLEAGLGYSSNPLLRVDSQSSVFGRISAYGVHSWSSERGSTSLTGYVENTTYLRNYGSKQIFDVGAHTHQSVSPTVTVFGDLDFAGDFAGQLSNRLFTVPTQPVPPEPGNPLPPVSTNPDVFGFSGRNYRVNGQVGASIRSGARGTISLTAGAQRSWFTGNNEDANYNTYFGSAGYSRQVSERTSAGATLYLQRQDYSHGDWANIINPVLTLRTQLSENINADAAVGIMAIEQRSDGQTDHSVTPSFSGSLCSTGTLSRLCARVARDATSSLNSRIGNAVGRTTVSTTASVDYFRTLSATETLQASLSAARYGSASSFNGDRLRTTYFSGVVGYDRKIGHRLAAGVQGGARKLFQVGPDPDLDLNANVYVRYRLGDLL
jgi:hypothetical protein